MRDMASEVSARCLERQAEDEFFAENRELFNEGEFYDEYMGRFLRPAFQAGVEAGIQIAITRLGRLAKGIGP